MSDQQDKSEEASPFKLEEARKKGQVPRSQELLSLGMLLAFLVVFSASIEPLARIVATHAHWWLSNAAELGAQWGFMGRQGGFSLREIGYALAPIMAALVLMAIVANLMFNGPVFSLFPIKPDFKRLHPIAGLKRMFSRKMFVELLKVLVKGALFMLVLSVFFKDQLAVLVGVATLSPMALPAAAEQLLMRLGYTLLAVMAAAALFDMWHSRRDFARQMRMSKREVKDEYRHREGDPEIRSRRKSIQQELLKKTAAQGNVRDADVVIVNPTHYAVALQYRPETMRAPVVLAMGRGLHALRLRQLARKHRVPILRSPALARTLYSLARVDRAIPDSTQDDVARVYRWVIALPGNKVISP